MQKGITIEQSLSANQKLAEHNNIVPMYNMLVGIPTETLNDLKKTGMPDSLRDRLVPEMEQAA